MLKKLITMVICVAAAGAVFAGAAEAGKKGNGNVKKGHTAQRRNIQIAVYDRSVELKHFSIELRCKGGYELIDLESGFKPSRLRKNNRIHDHQVGSTDDVYIRGRLGNHHVYGAIRVRDKLGSHRCDSHWVRFNARR